MMDGEKLLVLFRQEQKKNGNIGCTCNDCIEDMETAFKKFKELDWD